MKIKCFITSLFKILLETRFISKYIFLTVEESSDAKPEEKEIELPNKQNTPTKKSPRFKRDKDETTKGQEE